MHVEKKREKFAISWKYWSPDLSVTKFGACSPIRGYVTSVGKPSFDLGIPVDARQPKLMIRECRYKPLEHVIDPEILARAELESDNLVDFISDYGESFAASKDSLVYRMRESFFDRLGEIALTQDISKAADKICSVKDKQLKFDDFAGFVMESRKSLQEFSETQNLILRSRNGFS